jgi:hypothetical protein
LKATTLVARLVRTRRRSSFLRSRVLNPGTYPRKPVAVDNQFWIQIVGLIGSIVGGHLVITGNLLVTWLQHRKEKGLDEARKRLLEEM